MRKRMAATHGLQLGQAAAVSVSVFARTLRAHATQQAWR